MTPLPMKSMNLPPLIQDYSQDLNVKTPHYNEDKGVQTFTGRLVAKCTAQSQTFKIPGGTTERRLVHVDLEGSEFGAPSAMLDQNDLRGYYMEWIHYKIWCQSPTAAVNFATPLPDWSLLSEGPNTSNQTGSVSSSISYGFDASAGAMGDMPMGNVGGHLGVSNTHSHTLTDFTFMQHSDGKVLSHEVNMTMLGDGTSYKQPGDLQNPWQSPFVGIRLRELPNMAKSNVPIIGQGVWMNTSDAGLVDKLRIHISVVPNWQLVAGMFDGMTHWWSTAFGGTFNYSLDVDFSLLDK